MSLGISCVNITKASRKTGSASPDSQQSINGYRLAGRKLNTVYHKELNDYAEMIRFEIINMTIAERKKSVPVKPDPSGANSENPDKPDLSDDELDIPAYKRKGVKLKS